VLQHVAQLGVIRWDRLRTVVALLIADSLLISAAIDLTDANPMTRTARLEADRAVDLAAEEQIPDNCQLLRPAA